MFRGRAGQHVEAPKRVRLGYVSRVALWAFVFASRCSLGNDHLGVGNEPEGDSLKRNHKGWFVFLGVIPTHSPTQKPLEGTKAPSDWVSQNRARSFWMVSKRNQKDTYHFGGSPTLRQTHIGQKPSLPWVAWETWFGSGNHLGKVTTIG